MPDLKLVALDPDDLAVLSAHVQDAVAKVEDLHVFPTERRLALVLNRFDWLTADKREKVRRRSLLHFERVLGVKALGIRREAPTAVLNLLAVIYTPRDAPAGDIDLVFSGGGVVRMSVECVEA